MRCEIQWSRRASSRGSAAGCGGSSHTVAGAVYAEPLVVGARVIVATEHDLVYALDAASGWRLWEANRWNAGARSLAAVR